jgi:hypothetical protein
MIKGEHNYIYTLKQDQTLGQLEFKQGQEFNIVNEVVYMGGYPLQAGVNRPVYNWIKQNENLFRITNREY